LRETTTTISSY